MRHSNNFISSQAQDTLTRLGERIRIARKTKRVTLQDLERKCGFHRTTMSRLENGDPSVSISIFLAVLEAIGELSDIELILSRPAEPAHKRKAKVQVLDPNF